MTPLHNFTLEFSIKISPKLLYTLISTSEGLARWFADKVTVTDDKFIFEWEGSKQAARLLEFKENEYVRFEWLDDYHEGYSMLMEIQHELISDESALIISDYAEISDIDFSKMWWTSQVGVLQRLFNS
jgi:uncharacterized protein YndB with AHSA1/START domain